MIDLPKHKHLVLFDGVCNLCNSSVQYIIKHDKQNEFLFASLQSHTAKQVIDQFKIDISKIDSIVLLKSNKKLYLKSTAALKIAALLGFPNNMLSVFLIIPPFIRNWVYDFIARNRYKWYGKQESCMIPTEELKHKFLEYFCTQLQFLPL